MKNLITLTILSAAVAAGTVNLDAQQPAPAPRQPAPAGPPPAQAAPRPGRAGPGLPGFALAMFEPTRLLERRELLGLSAEQVTRLSTLETELTTARDKAETDSKAHREELQKLLQQSAPDAAQVRSHAQALMQAQQGAQLTTLTASVQAKAVLTAEQRGRVQGWSDGPRMGFGGRRLGPARAPGPEGPRGQAPMRMRRFRRI